MLTESAAEVCSCKSYEFSEATQAVSAPLLYNDDADSEADAVACYIADLTDELQKMASDARLTVLANLLQVAREEARLNCYRK